MRATRGAGLQPAMDHILANADKTVPSPGDDDMDEEDAAAAAAGVGVGAEAKSIKCSECGKTFRSQATASFHAERSGHQEFEESTEEVSRRFTGSSLTLQIKPLTEEEKKAKLEELRSKLAEKRAVQGKEDEKAQKANEVRLIHVS